MEHNIPCARNEMKKSLLILETVFIVVGFFVFFYASERNFIIAFLTSGRLTPWTVVEILGGVLALIGFIVAVFGVIKKSIDEAC